MPEPLVLIHGFTDTARTWDAVAPRLARDHEVLTPTLVGHRGGPAVPPGMTNPLDTMADGLEAVLDEAGHERAHLVGNSLGGWLAFMLAARGRALSVVALAPGHGWPEDAPPASTRRQFVRTHRVAPLGVRYGKVLAARPGLRKLAFRDLVAHPERIPPSTALALIEGAADCPMFEPYSAQLENADYRTPWEDFGVPVRIAWGEKDRTLPRSTHSGYFREALPDAEWVELPDCGHLPQHDDPELVARVVREVTTGVRA